MNAISILQSLGIKMVLLAGTLVLAIWTGWPLPQKEREQVSPWDGSHANLVAPASIQKGTLFTDRASGPGGSPPFASAHVRRRGSDPLGQAPNPETTRVDLNVGTVEDFLGLPGIGPVLARRIIDRRMVHGPFRSIEELKEVKGIGAHRLKLIRPHVSISG